MGLSAALTTKPVDKMKGEWVEKEIGYTRSANVPTTARSKPAFAGSAKFWAVNAERQLSSQPPRFVESLSITDANNCEQGMFNAILTIKASLNPKDDIPTLVNVTHLIKQTRAVYEGGARNFRSLIDPHLVPDYYFCRAPFGPVSSNIYAQNLLKLEYCTCGTTVAAFHPARVFAFPSRDAFTCTLDLLRCIIKGVVLLRWGDVSAEWVLS
jgi:hypothetical protein